MALPWLWRNTDIVGIRLRRTFAQCEANMMIHEELCERLASGVHPDPPLLNDDAIPSSGPMWHSVDYIMQIKKRRQPHRLMHCSSHPPSQEGMRQTEPHESKRLRSGESGAQQQCWLAQETCGSIVPILRLPLPNAVASGEVRPGAVRADLFDLIDAGQPEPTPSSRETHLCTMVREFSLAEPAPSGPNSRTSSGRRFLYELLEKLE